MLMDAVNPSGSSRWPSRTSMKRSSCSRVGSSPMSSRYDTSSKLKRCSADWSPKRSYTS